MGEEQASANLAKLPAPYLLEHVTERARLRAGVKAWLVRMHQMHCSGRPRVLGSRSAAPGHTVRDVNPLCLRKATALLCAVVSTCAQARVGEPQAAIERRLLAPGVGKLLTLGEIDGPRGPRTANPGPGQRPEASEASRRRPSEPPHRRFERLFPAGARERAYWKTALARQMSVDDGWQVHVVYLGDRSTLEAYQRVGEALNEFEVMALLAVNRGGSSWRKVEKEASAKSALGYAYELEDGTLRARQQGNWLLIFSNRLDEYAAERLAEEKAREALEQEQMKRLQQQKAPESVAGL